MIKIVTTEQMRAIERATDEAGISYADMMQHAGRAVAEIAKEMLGNDATGKRVTVLVGKGNNGGDGLVAARILKEETQAEVSCYLTAARGDDDPVYVATRDTDVFITIAEDDKQWRSLKSLVANADILIDAILGTGIKLPIKGDTKKLLDMTVRSLNRRRPDPDDGQLIRPAALPHRRPTGTRVIAVDCPSGLECDSGELDPAAIPADVTVTFAAAKYGQITFPGAEAIGELVVADINTPPDLPDLAAIPIELATGDDVAALLPQRSANSNKGTFGKALIVAGSVNYTGAAALAGKAAYRVGAGLVRMAVPQTIYPILASQLPEAIWLLLPHDMGVISTAALGVFFDELGNVDALLVGPGLGMESETAGFLRGLLRADHQTKKGQIGFLSARQEDTAQPDRSLPTSLVIDADGLNLLAEIEKWWELLPSHTVLTPHPGEMARLTGMNRDAIQADRIGVVSQKAAEWDCVVILKGAYTAIGAPDGRVTVIPIATDALATAGTGDVLAGCVVGLLAQGVQPFEAAVAGAYIHGLAGLLAGKSKPPRSVMASDVLHALPEALAEIEMTQFFP
ncbi:MAG: NAD(P)H-hydrate dehydratase [Anaerolineae bacterium]|nr:NAD(P)H-hydrate dehydratase [Anaerolineae bacterium]